MIFAYIFEDESNHGGAEPFSCFDTFHVDHFFVETDPYEKPVLKSVMKEAMSGDCILVRDLGVLYMEIQELIRFCEEIVSRMITLFAVMDRFGANAVLKVWEVENTITSPFRDNSTGHTKPMDDLSAISQKRLQGAREAFASGLPLEFIAERLRITPAALKQLSEI
jgi:hypothetical protein